MMSQLAGLSLSLFLSLIHAGCSEKKSFPAISDHVSRPVDVVTSDDGQHFFVLNSNASGIFDSGTIMTLDTAGNKVQTTPTPRLGRSLTIAGDDLIATFDSDGTEGSEPEIRLYSVAGSSLALQKSWKIEECIPVNAAMAKDYAYFAVSCENGHIALGELKTNRAESTLNVIRDSSSYVRRALLIDPERELLLAFVTELGVGRFSDQIYTDERAWNESKRAIEDGANEIPDIWEKSVPQLRAIARGGSQYNFMMIDLKKAVEEQVNGVFQRKDQVKAKEEMRWLYFNLNDVSLSDKQKYYRTNIWQAELDASGDCMYLSQRGLGTDKVSTHANNIVKACYIPNAAYAPTLKDDGTLVAPTTDSYLTFERVYGFKPVASDTKDLALLQKKDESYLGSFTRVTIGGTEMLVVTSVRDFIHFENPRYSIAVSQLAYNADFNWQQWPVSKRSADTYFQLAASRDIDGNGATIATCSYYDNSVRLFRLENNQTSQVAVVR